MTLREAISAGSVRLAAVPELAGNATRDAEWLLLHQLAISHAHLRAWPERELPTEEWERYQSRLARRLRMEPVQYITGEQEFYGLNLKVTSSVLIPRPETEQLVERVLASIPHDQPLRILDMGTGSGAIAIALATHLLLADITAVDLSRDALCVAKSNADAHGLQARIRFLVSDLMRAVAGECFDVVVSNPPYVSSADSESLHSEVREYEPAMALFAGPSGLDIYEHLIPDAKASLEPGGLLAMEIGFGQQPAVAALLTAWTEVSFHNDLQNIPRIVTARKPVN